jgi:hypothetical protein
MGSGLGSIGSAEGGTVVSRSRRAAFPHRALAEGQTCELEKIPKVHPLCPDGFAVPVQNDDLLIVKLGNVLNGHKGHRPAPPSKIRDFIDTMTAKGVLILGRFNDERKVVLDALRNRNYLPILFDFDSPVSKDPTGTVATLASLARFVIADVTDQKVSLTSWLR